MVKKHMGMDVNENPNPSGRGLSDLGKIMVAKMLDIGIIIDLVHCPPQAVKEIHQINSNRGEKKRPLVYSHTGIREMAQSITNAYDLAYLPAKEDVLAIKNCGGTVGIIFMNYWLNGKEEDSFFQYSPGIPIVIETMQTIASWCGSNGQRDYSNVSIGSDLDGFTETPDDLYSTSTIKNLVDELRKAGIAESDINKICFENYRRVLKNGWH
jgi:membrane dipeptidase